MCYCLVYDQNRIYYIGRLIDSVCDTKKTKEMFESEQEAKQRVRELGYHAFLFDEDMYAIKQDEETTISINNAFNRTVDSMEDLP